MLRQHIIANIQESKIHGVGSSRSPEHENRQSSLIGIPVAGFGKETQPRLALGGVPAGAVAETARVSANHALVFGEILYASVEREEDLLRIGRQRAVGDSRVAILLLDDEHCPGDDGGEADGGGDVGAGADDDLRAEAGEDVGAGCDGAEEVKGEEEVERGEERPGKAGLRNRNELVSGGRDDVALHVGGRAEEYDAGIRSDRAELVGNGESGEDVPSGSASGQDYTEIARGFSGGESTRS